MSHAYYAVIDRHGLRQLAPESVPGARQAATLRRRLDAAIYWIVVPVPIARLVQRLLDSAEFRTALILLAASADHYGPVLSELDDLAARSNPLAA